MTHILYPFADLCIAMLLGSFIGVLFALVVIARAQSLHAHRRPGPALINRS